MLNTTKNKKSKFHKAAIIGAAGLMCLSFTPVTAFQALADYVGDTTNSIGSETIRIKKAKNEVVRGDKYDVQHAYFGTLAGDKAIQLGMGDSYYDKKIEDNSYTGPNGASVTDITSKVTVYYSTGEVVDEFTATEGNAVLGSFTAHNVGEYTVAYEITVTYGELVRTYSTELLVTSTASTASLGFASDADVVPSIYDKALADKGTNKDIKLPKPLVFENAESDGKSDYVLKLNAGQPQDGEETVIVTVSGTSKGTITLEEDNGTIILKRSEIDKCAGNGDSVTVKYSYYTGKHFVASTSKQFTIYDNHYEEDGKDYSLTATHTTMTAITKVASKLSTIKAYTNKDLKEEVEVSVDAVAYRKGTSGNYDEQQAGSINKEKGEFTPWANGDYKIIYTVTDFYGNSTTTEEYIFDVVDSQKPVVYMYDANNDANDRANSKFVSAETKLMTKQKETNVVIYAIGATDNVNSAEEMNKNYKRTIKSSNRTIEITSYNKYNLIFDSNLATLAEINPVLGKEIKADLGDAYTEDQLKTWLKGHDYLLVTNTPKEGYTEAQYIAEGLAYIDVTYTGTLLIGSNSGTAYTVTYLATDLAGNTSASVSYTINVTTKTDFADITAPKVNLTSTFKKNYSKDEVIKFSKPTVSDPEGIDAYPELKIAYQYYKADGTTKVGSEFAVADKYEIDIASDFAKLEEEFKAENSDGTFEAPAHIKIFFTATDDYLQSNTIDVKADIIEIKDTLTPTIYDESYVTPSNGAKQNQTVTLPTITYIDDNANFISSNVEVKHVSKDDKGNIVKVDVDNFGKKETPVANQGEFQNYILEAGSFIASYAGTYEAVVTIRDYVGNYVVTYYHYDVAPNVDPESFSISTTLEKSQELQPGQELPIPAPTVSSSLTEKDGYNVYGIASDDTNKATDYRLVVKNTNNPSGYNSANPEVFMVTHFETYNYTVAYEVNLHIIKDTLTDFVITEDEGVYMNISGAKYYMNKLTKESDHDGDYVLVNKNAKGIANIYYGYVNGTDVTFYNLGNLTNGILTTADGAEAYVSDTNGTKYTPRIVNDELIFKAKGADADEYFTMSISGGKAVFTASEGLTGATIEDKTLPSAEAMALTSTNDYIVTTRTSELHYISAGDTIAPELTANYVYPETPEKGAEIEIAPINAIDESSYWASGIDKAASYVEIAFQGRTPSGAQTSYNPTFYDNKWTSYEEYNKDTEKLVYKLSSTNNGIYTITYHIKDKAGNEIAITEGKTQFKMKVGDVTEPTLKLDQALLASTYKVGDTLTLDFSKITMEDAVTTNTNDLMKTLSVKLTNTTTNKEVTNSGKGSVWNATTNKYDCDFSFKLDEVGTYKIEIKINDESYNYSTKTVEFKVEAQAEGANIVSTVVGVVLIVVAVLVLGGVVTYFVVSKVKLDKEMKKRK